MQTRKLKAKSIKQKKFSLDMLAGRPHKIDSAKEQQEMQVRIKAQLDSALASLTPKERAVLRARFGVRSNKELVRAESLSSRRFIEFVWPDICGRQVSYVVWKTPDWMDEPVVKVRINFSNGTNKTLIFEFGKLLKVV